MAIKREKEKIGEVILETPYKNLSPIGQLAAEILKDVSKSNWNDRIKNQIKEDSPEHVQAAKYLVEGICNGIPMGEFDIIRLALLESHSRNVAFYRVLNRLGFKVVLEGDEEISNSIFLESLDPSQMPQG